MRFCDFKLTALTVEGSQASGTARETEIKLVNVARASLEELLEDYRDFLRLRDAALWDKNSREALFVRKLGSTRDASYETYRTYIETRPAETVANIVICLIHQTNYLLDQQIRKLEQEFLSSQPDGRGRPGGLCSPFRATGRGSISFASTTTAASSNTGTSCTPFP